MAAYYSPIYYYDWPAYQQIPFCVSILQCQISCLIFFPSFPAIRCPFCTKPFPGGRIEDHLLSCLTSPPLPYNSKLPGCFYCCFLFHLLICQILNLSYLVQQLMCQLRTVESVQFVSKTCYKGKPSLDWPACVSTIRGNHNHPKKHFSICYKCFQIAYVMADIPLNSCIDTWSKVKPCCPEHPFD